MKISFYSKSMSFTSAMKEYVSTKFKKLKSLKEDEPVKFSYETDSNNFIVKAQIVLDNNKHVRASASDESFYEAVDHVYHTIKEQAKTVKEKGSRKEKHMREALPETEEPCCEDVLPKIVKTKRFKVESIPEAIAINEMERLGHETYIFRNINEDDKICLVYKRVDGDYSMIVVEN